LSGRIARLQGLAGLALWGLSKAGTLKKTAELHV
jgi:hypothetical protein